MGYQLWLPDVLGTWGLSPSVERGWERRGSPNFGPAAAMAHHTGADNDVTTMLRDGRPGLDGPLCNVELRRAGHVHVIAAGRANHAGKGSWRALVGNSMFLAVEASSAGRTWTQAQQDRYPLLMAALAAGLRRDASWVCDHKAYAGARGKWDLGAWNMDGFRLEVARHLRRPRREDDDDMTPEPIHVPAGEQRVYLIEGKDCFSGRIADAMVALSTHYQPGVPIWLWFEPSGALGNVTVRRQPSLLHSRGRRGLMHIVNKGTQADQIIGGNIVYRAP